MEYYYIVIKSNETPAKKIVKCLSRLLPVLDSECVPNIGVANEEQVVPSASKCVLEETQERQFLCRWPGVVPNKCPTLMNRIESAMSNNKFNDDVLHQHVKSLQLEWLGIARAIKSAVDASGAKSDPVTKLKQVFGVTPNDELLVNYWISAFCS